MDVSFLRDKIKSQEYDLSDHAHKERQVEKITITEIESAVLEGDIIERYPNDPRGESCLVAGVAIKKPLHIVCGRRGNRLLIVTVYRPGLPTWKDTKTRAKELKSRV